jgi:hypothetical protein
MPELLLAAKKFGSRSKHSMEDLAEPAAVLGLGGLPTNFPHRISHLLFVP